MIPNELIPCLQGAIPSHMATCAKDGTPNVSPVSQVFYVDDTHVAISNQFFNKTIQNISQNPKATVYLLNPITGLPWLIYLEYERAETEGALFDEMDMQLEAIASMMGVTGIFKLKSADIYRVTKVECLDKARNDL